MSRSPDQALDTRRVTLAVSLAYLVAGLSTCSAGQSPGGVCGGRTFPGSASVRVDPAGGVIRCRQGGGGRSRSCFVYARWRPRAVTGSAGGYRPVWVQHARRRCGRRPPASDRALCCSPSPVVLRADGLGRVFAADGRVGSCAAWREGPQTGVGGLFCEVAAQAYRGGLDAEPRGRIAHSVCSSLATLVRRARRAR